MSTTNDELARAIAREMIAAQSAAADAAADAATAPIKRAAFEGLSPADRMAAVKSGRRVID
jgi:hypothetical protein